MNIEQVINTLQWRYAVKKFDIQKKIDAKTWNALEETLILTPSSYGLHPGNSMLLLTSKLKNN